MGWDVGKGIKNTLKGRTLSFVKQGIRTTQTELIDIIRQSHSAYHNNIQKYLELGHFEMKWPYGFAAFLFFSFLLPTFSFPRDNSRTVELIKFGTLIHHVSEKNPIVLGGRATNGSADNRAHELNWAIGFRMIIWERLILLTSNLEYRFIMSQRRSLSFWIVTRQAVQLQIGNMSWGVTFVSVW